MSEKIKYTYEQLTNLILQNVEKLHKEKFDCIVAIASGGLFPSVLVKNVLKIPMYTVTVSSYTDEKRYDIKPLQWIDNNFENQKVLIVDEIDDTGSTLTYTVDRLRKDNNANDLSVFVIHNRIGEKCDNYITGIPYYQCEKIYTNNWISYPWKDIV